MSDQSIHHTLNVQSLTGLELDRHVAEVIQLPTYFDEEKQQLMYQATPRLAHRQWSPSKFWSQAGPLIEKMKIDLNWEWEEADTWTASIEPDINTRGETILEAAMRAIVATRYKQEYEVGQEIEKSIKAKLSDPHIIP